MTSLYDVMAVQLQGGCERKTRMANLQRCTRFLAPMVEGQGHTMPPKMSVHGTLTVQHKRRRRYASRSGLRKTPTDIWGKPSSGLCACLTHKVKRKNNRRATMFTRYRITQAHASTRRYACRMRLRKTPICMRGNIPGALCI